MEKEYIRQAAAAARELMETAEMKSGQILVVGCSSSEVESYRLGTHSSEETGKELFEAIYGETQKRGVFLAAQCCEHLNRALVLEREAAERYGYEPVSVVPWKKGGGAFATAAYYGMKDAVVVEHIRAHAGMDIGDVLDRYASEGCRRSRSSLHFRRRRGSSGLRPDPPEIYRRRKSEIRKAAGIT